MRLGFHRQNVRWSLLFCVYSGFAHLILLGNIVCKWYHSDDYPDEWSEAQHWNDLGISTHMVDNSDWQGDEEEKFFNYRKEKETLFMQIKWLTNCSAQVNRSIQKPAEERHFHCSIDWLNWKQKLSVFRVIIRRCTLLATRSLTSSIGNVSRNATQGVTLTFFVPDANRGMPERKIQKPFSDHNRGSEYHKWQLCQGEKEWSSKPFFSYSDPSHGQLPDDHKNTFFPQWLPAGLWSPISENCTNHRGTCHRLH